MAKIKYASEEIPLLNEHLGFTFQPNLQGQSMFPASQSSRARYPKQNHAQQFNQRQVTEWRNMDAGIQASWNNFAATYPQQSRVNPELFLTGYQLFVKRNFYKNQAGPETFSHMLYPEMEEIYPAVLSFTLTNNSGNIILDYSFDIANGKNCFAFYLSNRQKQSRAYAGTRSRFMVELINNPAIIINFGSLYNAHAVNDARNMAPPGWHIPTVADINTMALFIDPAATRFTNTCGGHLKETGLNYWSSPNVDATNTYLFSAVGGGQRTDIHFVSLFGSGIYWLSTPFNSTNNYVFQIFANSKNMFFPKIPFSLLQLNIYGLSVRYVADTFGETSCIGNDGTVYPVVNIGGQTWSASNSIETKYRNGDDIPKVEDQTTWAALTTGAYCYYNNLQSNSFTSIPQTLDLSDKFKSYFGLVPATGLFSMAKLIPYALNSGQFFPPETIVSEIL